MFFPQIIDKDHTLIDWKTVLQLEMKNEYQKRKEEEVEDKCDYEIGIEEFFMERVALAFTMNNPWIHEFNNM